MRNVVKRGWPYYNLWHEGEANEGQDELDRFWELGRLLFDIEQGMVRPDFEREHLESLEVLGMEIVYFDKGIKKVKRKDAR